MFNKLPTLRKYSKQSINIEQLVDIVKSNPQIELIDNIRSFGKVNKKRYDSLKLSVSSITPHGYFNTLNNKGLIKLSGYLYYDIDGFDTVEMVNDTIKRLIDVFPISFLCKSVGGLGISFLVKVIGLDNDNFNDVYSFFGRKLVYEGFNIDKNASGLVRKMIISSDKEVYYNEKASFTFDKVSFDNQIKDFKDFNGFKKIKKVDGNGGEEECSVIKVNDTFDNPLTLNELNKHIKYETTYNKEIKGDFNIEEIEYYKILLPKEIRDGQKHSVYSRVINGLFYINENITDHQVYSYLYYVNAHSRPKMNNDELIRLISMLCHNIRKTGEIRIKTRVKKIHFNKMKNLTPKDKMKYGPMINGALRTNRTIDVIREGRLKCISKNIPPTQKNVKLEIGLSLATIKRNWTKEKIDIDSIKIVCEFDAPDNFFDDIPTKNEDDFFD